MRSLAWILGATAFLMNPNWACSGEGAEDRWEFGAAEMKAVAEGTWQLTVTRGNETADFAFEVAQAEPSKPHTLRSRSYSADWLRSAHACGDRTFVKAAAACLPSSSLPVTATYVSGDVDLGAHPLWDTETEMVRASGSFETYSYKLGTGRFYLSFGDLKLSATLNPDATVTEVSGELSGEASDDVVVTLVRLSK